MTRGAPATVDMHKLVLKEIDLRGTIAYVRDYPAIRAGLRHPDHP
ncbi:hypothetical protein [Pseudarthrobacter phenanthrenivorans]|nr:hypothetical protein [Pseudarthrobacter phenanthrenivorans]